MPAPYQHGARGRLTRVRRVAVYWICAMLWVSGAGWLVFRHFMRTSGEFGELPHPLEVWWLRLHGAAAFASLWLIGLLWAVHIMPAWRTRRRSSGIVLALLAVLLIASGWWLYYGGESMRDGIACLHWILGLGAIMPLLVHVLKRPPGKAPGQHM